MDRPYLWGEHMLRILSKDKIPDICFSLKCKVRVLDPAVVDICWEAYLDWHSRSRNLECHRLSVVELEQESYPNRILLTYISTLCQAFLSGDICPKSYPRIEFFLALLLDSLTTGDRISLVNVYQESYSKIGILQNAEHAVPALTEHMLGILSRDAIPCIWFNVMLTSPTKRHTLGILSKDMISWHWF